MSGLERDPSYPSQSIFSPAFRVAYPDIRNLEEIPWDIRNAMEPSWTAERFIEREVKLTIYDDAFVVEEGLAFLSDGSLIESTRTQHDNLEVQRGRESLTLAKQVGSNHLPKGVFVLLKKRGVQNYGHWLIEMLPKGILAKQYFCRRDLGFIVSEATGQLASVMIDSLRLSGISEDSLFWAGREPLRVRHLVIVDGLTQHGTYMSPLVQYSMDGLAARVPAESCRKLFISRKSSSCRRFVNEDDLCRRAAEAGFRIIDPVGMTFRDQIATFKGAEVVVGAMGAAMTNITFAPRHAKIWNLAPASMPDTFFWFIATLSGQDYTEVRCRQVGHVLGIAPWDTDLSIEDELLDELLK